MKNHSIKLTTGSVCVLFALSICTGLAESPTPSAKKQLDKVIENTRHFDNPSKTKGGGSTLDTPVRAVVTVPSSQSTVVRSTNTATTQERDRKAISEYTKAPANPNHSPAHIDRIVVPSPVVKPQPQPKEKPKSQPTGTVSTGGK